MKKFPLILIVLFLISAGAMSGQNTQGIIGGKLGMSSIDGNAGLLLGPMGELKFNKNMAAGSEFNINTQTGTPIEWAFYFKYYIDVQGSQVKPYVNGGFSLWFYTGGPYFGLRFGGGVNFPVAPKISIPADLQFGPVFASGTSVFLFTLSSGIRYEL